MGNRMEDEGQKEEGNGRGGKEIIERMGEGERKGAGKVRGRGFKDLAPEFSEGK